MNFGVGSDTKGVQGGQGVARGGGRGSRPRSGTGKPKTAFLRVEGLGFGAILPGSLHRGLGFEDLRFGGLGVCGFGVLGLGLRVWDVGL